MTKSADVTSNGAIHRARVPSPIGALVLTATDEALVHLELPSGPKARRGSVDRPRASQPAPLRAAVTQLEQYFAGRRQRFDLSLALDGTPFQTEVWQTLADIPYGATISYAELAAMVGRPTAFRAVGQANGANPIPIVLPCHRVVASDGRIGGYGGGLATKRRLLSIEGVRGI